MNKQGIQSVGLGGLVLAVLETGIGVLIAFEILNWTEIQRTLVLASVGAIIALIAYIWQARISENRESG